MEHKFLVAALLLAVTWQASSVSADAEKDAARPSPKQLSLVHKVLDGAEVTDEIVDEIQLTDGQVQFALKDADAIDAETILLRGQHKSLFYDFCLESRKWLVDYIKEHQDEEKYSILALGIFGREANDVDNKFYKEDYFEKTLDSWKKTNALCPIIKSVHEKFQEMLSNHKNKMGLSFPKAEADIKSFNLQSGCLTASSVSYLNILCWNKGLNDPFVFFRNIFNTGK